jgi:hypothetical protein
MATSGLVTSGFRNDGEDERANCRPGKTSHGRDEATQQEGQIVPSRNPMLYRKKKKKPPGDEYLPLSRGERQMLFSGRTQIALVR